MLSKCFNDKTNRISSWIEENSAMKALSEYRY